MTPDKARKVLDALEFLARMANVSHNELDSVGQAIAIMREEAGPPPCPNGEPCKHAGWCTEVYCQGIPVFRNQFHPWLPIETAPKDGTAIMLGARCGAWIGKYLPVYQSGFKPDNPWSSLMLNHDHLYEKWQTPTHWMPLPEPPGAAPQAPAEPSLSFGLDDAPAVEISDAEIDEIWLLNGGGLAANRYHDFARALLEKK